MFFIYYAPSQPLFSQSNRYHIAVLAKFPAPPPPDAIQIKVLEVGIDAVLLQFLTEEAADGPVHRISFIEGVDDGDVVYVFGCNGVSDFLSVGFQTVERTAEYHQQ